MINNFEESPSLYEHCKKFPNVSFVSSPTSLAAEASSPSQRTLFLRKEYLAPTSLLCSNFGHRHQAKKRGQSLKVSCRHIRYNNWYQQKVDDVKDVKKQFKVFSLFLFFTSTFIFLHFKNFCPFFLILSHFCPFFSFFPLFPLIPSFSLFPFFSFFMVCSPFKVPSLLYFLTFYFLLFTFYFLLFTHFFLFSFFSFFLFYFIVFPISIETLYFSLFVFSLLF